MKTKAKYKLSEEQRDWLENIPRLYIPTKHRSTIEKILQVGRYTKKQREILNEIRIRYITREKNLSKAVNPVTNKRRLSSDNKLTDKEIETLANLLR